VQFRVDVDELDRVPATADAYVKTGVTDFLLIVPGADPVAIGEQVAARFPAAARTRLTRRPGTATGRAASTGRVVRSVELLARCLL